MGEAQSLDGLHADERDGSHDDSGLSSALRDYLISSYTPSHDKYIVPDTPSVSWTPWKPTLSRISTASQREDLDELLSQWGLDPFECTHGQLKTYLFFMFENLRCRFTIRQEKLKHFIDAVAGGYRYNPYHNLST